jgi:hypothetical protein
MAACCRCFLKLKPNTAHDRPRYRLAKTLHPPPRLFSLRLRVASTALRVRPLSS